MSRWNPQPIEVRFYERTLPEPNSGCWLWTGDIEGGGYGCLLLRKIKVGPTWKKVRVKAHRVSWELHRGVIPEGMEVCHTCDLPCCVNPDHLFVGTHKQNMDDRDRKGRVARWERAPHAKVTRGQVAEIRASHDTGFVLADRFGISFQTISEIRRGLIWRDLPEGRA